MVTLSCGTHGVPLRGYRVELEQDLAHHRYHRNVARLPALTEAVIKRGAFRCRGG